MSSDIVNLTSDVMKKLGRLIDAEHQLCMAHALQLGVIEVLYKKRPEAEQSENQPDSEVEESDETDTEEELEIDVNFSMDDLYTTNEAELTGDCNIAELISKVRDVVKLFRRSPTKNDEILQKYVLSDFKEDLNLTLDCKTRWSSLLSMFKRFDKLKICIQKALLDLKSDISFTQNEYDIISSIKNMLLPVKLAVEALCRANANLLSANITLGFMLENIGSGHLENKLKAVLKRQISKRTTPLWSICQYLHNVTTTHDALDMPKLSKENLAKMVVRPASQPKPQSEEIDDNQNEIQQINNNCVVYGPESMGDQLKRAIGSLYNSKFIQQF